MQEEEEEKGEEDKGADWDFEFIDKDETLKFKCRVDKVNQVNVLVQTDFMFENPQKALITIKNCSEIFHSSEYPIIVIESRNDGGLAVFGFIFMEMLQTAIYPTEYLSYRLIKLYLEIILVIPMLIHAKKQIHLKIKKQKWMIMKE